jgi:hypothetical protein
VQRARVVALDDKNRLPGTALLAAGRLGRLLKVALAAILVN